MKKRILGLTLFCVMLLSSLSVSAQRKMENLDHGTLAVKTSEGVFITWRVLGSEWKDVSYNLYRDGNKLNSDPITGATNFVDATGTLSSSYFVRPIVDSIEKDETCTATVWDKSYIDIPLNEVEGYYTINDASLGDLDGDGDYEIIIKRKAENINDLSKKEYHLLQAYHLDPAENLNSEGKVEPIWTINMGPNLYDPVETNFLVWDLDEDGKAELITRTSDATVDGEGKDFGDAPGDHQDGITDYRFSVMSGYRTKGPDFLSVFDGETGGEIARDLYIERDPMEQYGSTGGGAAHRSTKCMFTVAYLDGKKPSVIIGRGIYERIKMEAWDFDGANLTKRWAFDTANAPAEYHGSGNHNLSLADVDFDGKDEVVYGAMVIDDDGTGLHSNGLRHGDALHVGDFDPDRFGLEIWRCLENNTGAILKTGEKGEEIVRYRGNRDNGRCCAGDINPDHRGAEVWAATECPTYNSKGQIINPRSPFPMNFMVWWDGDLLREFLDHTWNEPNGVGNVTKRIAGDQRTTLLNATGTLSNNWTKGTPCVSADIFGDWREEIVWRRNDNMAVRLYVSITPTTHRLYTLMHDSQYREAIAWQMNSYNQPPHPSYFLGHDMDSVAPPAMVSNELVWKQGPIWDETATSWVKESSSIAFKAGDDVLFDLSGENSESVNLLGTLTPRSVRVQTATDYAFAGTGSLSGKMDFNKAGIGKLTIENDNDYSGITRVYLGKLEVNGDLSNSQVIVKRFAELYGAGIVGNGVLLQDAAALYAGKENGEAAHFIISGGIRSLGNANIYLDLSDNADGSTKTNDKLVVDGDVELEGNNILNINMLDGDLEAAEYELISFTGEFTGDLNNLTIGGIPTKSVELKIVGKSIVLVVNAIRQAGEVVWKGDENSDWDLANTKNWLNKGAKDYFVGNDKVTINDDGSANTTINITTEIPTGSTEVNSSLDYTLTGTGSLVGEAGITKKGTGKLRIINQNSYTGVTEILGGEISVLTVENGGNVSNLGAATADASNLIIDGGKFTITTPVNHSTNRGITVGSNNATINLPGSSNLVQEGSIVGDGALIKEGSGMLTLTSVNTQKGGTILKEGTIKFGTEEANIGGLGGSITFESGTLDMQNSTGSYTNSYWDIIVPEGKNGTLRADGRVQLYGSLTGAGRLNVYTPFVRTDFRGNWSEFAGMINITAPSGGGDFRVYNRFGYPKASVVVGNNVNYYVESNGGVGTMEIGSLILFGSGTFAGTTGYFTWKIGGTNENSLIYGVIRERGNTGIEKVGTGDMNLKGANTYKRYTYVNGGAVICDNTSGSATGSSPVSINATGVLKGKGSCAGIINVNNGGTLEGTLTLSGLVSVAKGGTLSPGGDLIGAMEMKSNVTLRTGSIFKVDVSTNKQISDVINVTGTVSLAGNLVVDNDGNTPYQNGDKFQIINASNITGTFESVTPSKPAEGLMWDLSDIQNGYLSISIETSVNDIWANAISVSPNPSEGTFFIRLDDFTNAVDYTITDLQGRMVKAGVLNGNQQSISIEGEPTGVYLIQLIEGDKKTTKRIMLL